MTSTRHTPLAVTRWGSGHPVLTLHGLGGDHEQALGLLPDDGGLAPIAIDMPGHGDTDLEPDEPLGFVEFAGHAAGVLDRMHADGGLAGPVPVVGVSMGAGIALALAHQRPDLVRGLVLIRPAWLDVTPPPHLAVFPLIGGLLSVQGPQRGAQTLRGTDIYRQIQAESPAMAASLLGQLARRDAVTRTRVLIEMPYRAALPTPDALYRLDVAAVVVGAPEDPVHPLWLARAMAERLPRASFALAPRKDLDPTQHEVAVRAIVARALAS